MRAPVPLPRSARPGSGLSSWFEQNRGRIGDLAGDIGTGLLQGKNWQQGLAMGFDQSRQMEPYRQERREQTQQRNATIDWLQKQGRDDLIARLEAGEPMASVWAEATAKPAAPDLMTVAPGGSVIDKSNPGAGALFTAAPDPKDAFNQEQTLSAAYANADPVKVYNAVRDGYERVTASAYEQSGAGDMALLYGYMKILDPGSVVRESEFAMAAQAGSLPEQIQGAALRVINGQRLTEEQRQEFLRSADALYQETSQNLADFNTQAEERARAWDVDFGRYGRQPEFYPPRQSAPTLPGAAAMQDLMRKYGLN